jgi:hypothetical protein
MLTYTGKRKRGGAKKWTSEKQKQRAMGDNLDKKKGWEAKDESGLVCVRERERDACVCVCVCVCPRAGRPKMRAAVCVCVCVGEGVCVCRCV